MAPVITYLKLEVVNPGLNQAVVSLSFVKDAERKTSPKEKEHSLGDKIIFIHRDDYLFIADFYSWTSVSCLHHQQKALVICSAKVLRCHNTQENVL